jgi:hypothetical protein
MLRNAWPGATRFVDFLDLGITGRSCGNDEWRACYGSVDKLGSSWSFVHDGLQAGVPTVGAVGEHTTTLIQSVMPVDPNVSLPPYRFDRPASVLNARLT